MDMSDPHCHTSSIAVSCSPEAAFAYVSDGVKHGDWTLGSMDRKALGDDLFTGTSMFDRSQAYIRLRTDPGNLMVYADVGPSPDRLVPKNIIRVTPGTNVGRGPNECLVTLMTWRAKGTSDPTWLQTCSSHDTEMFIIKDRLEKGD